MSKLQLTNGYGPDFTRDINGFFEAMSTEGRWVPAAKSNKISIDVLMSRKVAGFEDGYQRTAESTQTALDLLEMELRQIMHHLGKTADRPNEFELQITENIAGTGADLIPTYDEFCVKYRNIPILFVNDIKLTGMANRLFEYEVTYDPYSNKAVGHIYRMMQNVGIVFDTEMRTFDGIAYRLNSCYNALDFTQMITLSRSYEDFPIVRFDRNAHFPYWKSQVKLIDEAAVLFEPIIAEFKTAADHLNALLEKSTRRFEIIKEAM